MSQGFDPKNDLERSLMDAQEGRIPAEEFFDVLMRSEVFMPVYEKHHIEGFAASDKAQPLTLKDETTGEETLIIFTNPDRAKDFTRDYPGYDGGLVAEFTWILEKLGFGYGISLNPDQEVGIDLEAGALRQLATKGH